MVDKVTDKLFSTTGVPAAIGTDGTTITDSATNLIGHIGVNNANNAISSAAVVANADGSGWERMEYIQSKIAEAKAVIGALTDAALKTTDVATQMNLLREIIAEIVALQAMVGTLTDVAADTSSTATQHALLRQIAEAVNNGTGTAIAANKSLVDYIGACSTSSLEARIGALNDASAETADVSTIISLIRKLHADLDTADTAIDNTKAVVGSLTDVADETANTATIINLLRAILAKALPREVYKTVAFDGGAGSGGIGSVALYTVTGAVRVKITAICTETLVGAATLECGIAGSTAGIIAQIADATDLIAGELWYDATPTTKIDTEAVDNLEFVLGDGQDLLLTIGAANITDGTIAFKVRWEPLTSGATVVAV